jgi:copper chaperone CopZ
MRFRSIRFIALSSVLLIPLAAGCQSSANQFGGAEATQPIDSPTATLLVYGMGCPLCANNLDKQLLAMGNVEKVEVDMGTGKVKTTFAPTTRPTRSQIARAVEESGFKLVRIDTP